MGQMPSRCDTPLFFPATPALVGRICEVSPDGRAQVEFPGAPGPLPALCAVAQDALPARDTLPGAPVLLVFEDGDATRPVIVGFIRERLWADPTQAVDDAPVSGALRAARVVIEGEQEVVIRCGEGSISLAADGRILIKGRNLTSRAAETNKVRGAVVLVN